MQQQPTSHPMSVSQCAVYVVIFVVLDVQCQLCSNSFVC